MAVPFNFDDDDRSGNSNQAGSDLVFMPKYSNNDSRLSNNHSDDKKGNRNKRSKMAIHDAPLGDSIEQTSNEIAPFDRIQLTKLLIHTLKELGYNSSAFTLQEESGGIQVESTIIQKLFHYIKTGKYEFINLDILLKAPLINGTLLYDDLQENSDFLQAFGSELNDNPENLMKIDNVISSGSNNQKILNAFELELLKFNKFYKLFAGNLSVMAKFKNILEIMILVLKQFFLELIYAQSDSSLAVVFLRNVIRNFIQIWDSTLGLKETFNEEELLFTPEVLLRELSTLLTNSRILDNKRWDEKKLENSREYTIEQISAYINPNDLVPRGRLITLLKQAIKYQRSQDMLNLLDSDEDELPMDEYPSKSRKKQEISLLQDNISEFQKINFIEKKTLLQNSDEIWYLQFSPDGRYLASASADTLTDRKILVYDVENDFQVYKILANNTQCVLYLSFSPDSKYLVSCPFNEIANIYDIHSSGEPANINPLVNEGENSNSQVKHIVAEIIQPIDSVLIPSFPVSSPSSVSSAPDTSSSSSPTSNNDTTGSARNQTNGLMTGNSPRIWCCDWFHSPQHSGKFVVGSPDRDVVIYDTVTKSIIYRLASKISPGRYPTNGEANGSALNNNNSSNDMGSSDSELFPRIHDIKVTYDDKYLILMTHQGTVDVYDISGFPSNDILTKTNNSILDNLTLSRISRLNVKKNMTCISLPQPIGRDISSSLLLINLQFNEIQLWDFKESLLIQKYYGQKQEQFIIRSCFGFNNKLVISGSEDGKIYIWDRVKGNIVGVLAGHVKDRPVPIESTKRFGKNCNVVAWNNIDTTLFASGGDDGYIKVWRLTKE